MKFRDLFNDKTWLPDWDRILTIKEFRDLMKCPQSKIWHKEGNVWVHTNDVTWQMYSFLRNRENVEPSDNEYYIMMMSAALCHDLGKPSTTKFDQEKGDYSTKFHGSAGDKIVRRLFFDEEFELREKVCYMVRHHMTLHHIFDKEEWSTRKMIQLSHGRVRVKDMLILNLCDSLGSKNDIEGPDFIVGKEERIKSLAGALNCYETPYEFNNALQKRWFFTAREERYPDWKGVSFDPDFTMYVMVGGPGSGKNHYIENHLQGVKTISRDDIRAEIGIGGEKPQGNKKQEEDVTRIFYERIYKHCINRESFVINNTNVKRQYRDDYTKVTLPYEPRIVYIYVEAPSIEEQKKRRDGMMPLEVIDRMWDQFDFPDPSEYDELITDIQH